MKIALASLLERAPDLRVAVPRIRCAGGSTPSCVGCASFPWSSDATNRRGDTLMADLLVSVPVLLAGLYLVALAAVALVSPQRAKRFLLSFASSASAHFLELSARLVVGAALVLNAPRMKWAGLFAVFGWVIVVTTIGLLAVPWRWHRRFATWSVPYATRNMWLFAVGSLTAGVLVLLAVACGPGAQHWGLRLRSDVPGESDASAGGRRSAGAGRAGERGS
jgi:hypothetical protein